MNGSVLFEGNPILSGSLNVNTGGNIEPLEVEITENGTREITPPSGVDGYAPITIETNVPQIAPVLETLNVTQNGRYEPPSGVAGFDEVNVEVLHPLDTLSVTENGSYEPPTGVYGFSNVNVNVPTPTPVLNTLNVTQNGIYTPPSGVDGYNEVDVEVPLPSNAYLLKELSNLPQQIASFSDGSDNPLKSLTASIVPVQSGSGDPSPTNVRPISGWSGCNIGNLGSKNWYDTRQSLLAGYLNGDGTAGGTDQSINKHTEPIPIKGGITFTYSVAVSRNADQVCLWYDKNNNVIDGFVLLKNTTSITAQAPINAISTSLTVYNVDGQTIQLEAGSQATAYEPYNPNSTTTTIPFTDSQGNPVEVYGGSVDVVNGKVKAVSKNGYVDLGTLRWNKQAVGGKTYFVTKNEIADAKKSSGINYIQGLLCSNYKEDTWAHVLNTPGYDGYICIGWANKSYIAVNDTRYNNSTASEFQTALNGVQLVYQLATPLEYDLADISISTNDGENNVFASTGDVEELKYFARATS